MNILNILNEYYPIHFDRNELMRDAGSVSYAVFSGNDNPSFDFPAQKGLKTMKKSLLTPR